MKNIIGAILFFFIFSKCSNSGNSSKEVIIDSVHIHDSLYEVQRKNFFESNNAITGWDTLKYTFQLQDIIKDTPILGMRGYIMDIIKYKLGYIVKFSIHIHRRTATADLFIDLASFNKYKIVFLNEQIHNLFIAGKIEKMTIYSPQLITESDFEDNNTEYNDKETYDENIVCNPYLSLDTRETLIKLKGIFIGCIKENN